MNPPPQYFYQGYIKTQIGLRYLSAVQAVGPNQARERILADWRKIAPQMVADIEQGKVTLILRRTGIKRAKREANSIPSQPEKTGIFTVFPRSKVRMEVKQPYLDTAKDGGE